MKEERLYKLIRGRASYSLDFHLSTLLTSMIISTS